MKRDFTWLVAAILLCTIIARRIPQYYEPFNSAAVSLPAYEILVDTEIEAHLQRMQSIDTGFKIIRL
jgi:hypothetical protein